MIATATGWTCSASGACAFATDRPEAFYTIAGFAGFLLGALVWGAIFGSAR